jgi:membrane protein
MMNKGHQALSPWQMPRAAWKDIASRTWQRTWDDNVGLVAAGVAFYGFFALVSIIGIVVLAYGLVAEPRTVVDHMQVLTDVLPPDIALLIGEQALHAVTSSEAAKGTGLLIALAAALYGGTNGAAALITALNIAYEEKEKRSLARFYLLALLMTLAAVAVTLAALAGTAFVATIGPGGGTVPLLGKMAGYVLLLLASAVLISLLYRYVPSRHEARWVWITPGSMLAAAVWLLLTVLFGFYLTNLANFSATYGSLGALAALQTWLYLSAYVLVLGAELNSEIEHQTARDSTVGPEGPIGKRGAWAADNVATSDEVEDRPEETREGEKLTQATATIADSDGSSNDSER